MRCFWDRVVFGVGLLAASFCADQVAAADAVSLRYAFQTGKEFSYEVKIVADTDESEETREGVISYKTLSANDNQVVLKHSGTLGTRSKPKQQSGLLRGPRRIGPPRFGGGPRFIAGPEGVTLNRQGKMLVARELTHLPFLLGDMEMLVIEEFPVEAKERWVEDKDLAILEREQGAFMFGPPHATSTTQRTAKERTEYAILGVQGDRVRLSKKYSLRSGNEGTGAPRFDMSGSGEFSFDTKEGVIANMAMKYEIHVNEPNVTLRIPVTLDYRLLTPAEVAEYRKRAEEARAKAAADLAKANAPKPLVPGEREQLLKDLASVDPQKLTAAADRLAKAPADDQAADFAKRLAPLLTHSNDWVKGAAANALMAWATPEAEEALIEATTSENIWVRARSIVALGRVKTEKAAEAVAAQMYRNRGEATKSLKAIGPVAETATISVLKDRDGWVRGDACEILGEIGGKKALKALQEYSKKATGFDVGHAAKAIAAIEQRLAQGGPQPSAVDAKSAVRTWRDASGVFEIQATLEGVNDGKVQLKRTDGRTISVPLDKLSNPDQDYIRQRK